MRLFASLLLATSFPVAALAEDPFADADLKAGKDLHDRSCISCHVRYYGGDGSKMYTRDGRLLHNRRELLQRVASCNAMTRTGWFPEEEAAVAAWLNQQYYHFKQ